MPSLPHDVSPRTGPDTCAGCHGTFRAHDRLVVLYIVAGTGPHPQTGRLVALMSDHNEAVHFRCADPALRNIQLIVTAPSSALSAEIRPRTPSHVCVCCRATLRRGDRVLPLYMVEGLAVDPETGHPAAKCSGEFEVVHFDCRDPDLALGQKLVLSAP